MMFSVVLKYIRQHRGKFALAIALLFLVDIIQLFIPLVVKSVVDSLRHEVSVHSLFLSGISIVAMGLVMLVLRSVWRIVLASVSHRIATDLRQKAFEKILYQQREFFGRNETGDLMARATNDLGAVRMLFSFGLVSIFDMLVLGAAALFFMLWLNPKLTAIAVAPLPLLALIVYLFENRIHRTFTRVQERYSQITSFVQEAFAGILLLKSFSDERPRTSLFAAQNEAYVRENLRLAQLNALFDPMLMVVIGVSNVMVFWFGGRDVIRGAFSLGELIAFVGYLETLAWPVMAMGFSVSIYQRGTASLKRIEEIAELPLPSRSLSGVARSTTGTACAVSMRDLNFSYEGGEPVLRNFSLEIEAGKTLGILGRIGTGKSTLARILSGLVDVPRGKVFVDGIDVMDWRLDALRKMITFVPQDPFLFSASFGENLTLGKPDASEAEVEEVAFCADLSQTIDNLSQGLNTLVGERGVTLSGGQKQRLALARGLLKPAPLYILDDCFSSVDTETEERILERTRKRLAGATAILITHRVSTLKHADEIIVLDSGCVRERGSHESLLALGGMYRDLWERQQLSEKLARE
jgi:ATP-binding cassette subfamily B multidrug efflux pump